MINLRGSADAGECSIVVRRDNEVVFAETVAQGTASITIKNQKASGPVKYSVIINDQDGFEHWEEF